MAYDGSPFAGWAVQPGERTVEGELRAAIATVLRVPVDLTVAGRTDRGVHALGQDKFTVHKLFEEVAPRYAERPGGYTRILKLGPRRSDATEMVLLELV